MISQPVSSIFLCSPLPSATWRTPGLSIPWCYLPTTSALSSSPFRCALQDGFGQTRWTGDISTTPQQFACLNRNDGQEIFVWSDCLLDLGTDFLVGNMVLLWFLFGAVLWGSMIHKHTGRWMWQGSTSDLSWIWDKYSCHSILVST